MHNLLSSYGEPTNEGYTNKLLQAFLKLQSGPTPADSSYSPTLFFDGANGVGGIQMARMAEGLTPALQVLLYNDGSSDGELNKLCGADHVKVCVGVGKLGNNVRKQVC